MSAVPPIADLRAFRGHQSQRPLQDGLRALGSRLQETVPAANLTSVGRDSSESADGVPA